MLVFDISFHIKLFISIIATYIKKHQIKGHTLLYLFISLIEVEHTLKTSNKKTCVNPK